MHAFAQSHISVLCLCKRQAICNVFDVMHSQLGDMSVQVVVRYALVSVTKLHLRSLAHAHICVCPAESSHHNRMVLRQPTAAGTTSEFDY